MSNETLDGYRERLDKVTKNLIDLIEHNTKDTARTAGLKRLILTRSNVNDMSIVQLRKEYGDLVKMGMDYNLFYLMEADTFGSVAAKNHKLMLMLHGINRVDIITKRLSFEIKIDKSYKLELRRIEKLLNKLELAIQRPPEDFQCMINILRSENDTKR